MKQKEKRMEDVLNNIGRLLMEEKETIAVAESVTSGTIQTMLSSAMNATFFYQGGITAYNLDRKANLLNVDEDHAAGCNCVSEKVAAQMAYGVCRLFESGYGIGITGYASPIPEKDLYDLFAFYAIAHHGKVIGQGKLSTDKDDPKKAQQDYAEQVLQIFEKQLATKIEANDLQF